MDQNERQVIDGLFDKLRQVDRQAPQRDAEAEAMIRQQVAALPPAPYYMAQALLVQEQALAGLQNRVQQLEREATERQAGGGGFLGGLFGGTQPIRQADRAPTAPGPIRRPDQPPIGAQATPGPWGRPAMGGGFLAGAMQTALGVAGGMLLADALSHAFAADEPGPDTLAQDAGWGEPGQADPYPQDAGFDDPGFDVGGDDGFDV